jgi:hypothetical protein
LIESRSAPGRDSFLSRVGNQAFILRLLARKLARATRRLTLLPRGPFGRFLIKSPTFHLSEDAFALHLPFQCFESLIDVVVANEYLQVLLLMSE